MHETTRRLKSPASRATKTVGLTKSPNYHSIFIYNAPNDKIMKVIDKALSYEIPNSAFLEPTINPRTGETELWDGVTHLLRQTKRGDWYFPAGLRPTVTKILNAYGYEIEYTERSRIPEKVMELGWHGKKLRDYQEEQVKRVIDKLKKGEGAIIPLPTGSGKTYTMMWIIKELGVKTIIFVHQKELLKQWVNEIKATLHITPARYDATHKDIGSITVAMIQTTNKHMTAIQKAKFDLVCVDEAHRCPSAVYYSTLMKLDARYRIGLTATPRREDNAMLKFVGGIGDVIEGTVNAKELMDEGYLAKAKLEFINAPPAPGGTNWHQWQTAYTMGISGNKARNELIAKRAIELANGGKLVYIHVKRIKHGQHLKYMIGSQAKFTEAKSKNREEVLEEFKNGKLKILISTLLGCAVDIPAMDVIILACGGKSETATIQAMGRAIRKTDGKEEALLIDFNDVGKWLRDHSSERREAIERVFGN
jgi:superfamily II DNA or RNA helicase